MPKQIEGFIQKLGIRIKLVFPVLLAFFRKSEIRLNPFFVLAGKAFSKIANLIKLLFGKLTVAFLRMGAKRTILLLAVLSIILASIWLNNLYITYYGPNVEKNFTLFIHNEDNFDRVVTLLKENARRSFP